MASTSKQRLALAICDFLSTSLTDGTLQADEKDSIDIAINCIAEAFGIDPADKAAVSSAIGSQNLLQIYSVYEKLKNSSPPKPAGGSSSSSSSSSGDPAPAPSPAAAAAAAAAPGPVSDEAKKQAEALKSKGNAAMAQKDYAAAVELYTQALALHPGNAVFLSNRAAAHSAAKDHAAARADAEAAVAADPAYTKAWSRLGLARFVLGDPRGAMDAYRRGIDAEGAGGSDAMRKGFETARRRVEELDAEEREPAPAARGAGAAPGLGDLAGMFGGGGGAGGGAGAGAGAGAGGMPDLSSIMGNPMFASMAQNLMSNPDMMSNLMSNPRLRDMASQFSSGGGMPDMSALMSDPNIAEMARSLMGGGGAGRGGPPSQ